MFMLEETHFWFVGKRMFIKQYLDPIEPSIHSILDIGSGTGGTTKWLEHYGSIIGLEKNPYSVALATKRGIKIVMGNAHKLPFKKESFDLVTILDVLYHQQILNIDSVLQETYRVLKPGGYLLITDSALPFLFSEHDKFLFGKRRFLLKQLQQQIPAFGFQIVKSSYIFFFIFPLILLKRKIIDLIYSPKKSDVWNVNKFVNRVLIIILKLESVLLNKISFPIGSSVIILAKKN